MVFVNSWSHVSSDVLSLIINKLTLRDAVRFGAVCPQWHTLFELKRSSLRSSPWLYKSATNDIAVFYSIADNDRISVRVPDPPMSSRRCIGANHGYLVTVDEACKVHLLQPLSGEQIELPPIGTLDFIEPLSDTKGHIKAYLNMDAQAGEELVLPSKLRDELCYFASVSKDLIVMMADHCRRRLFFARANGKSWEAGRRPPDLFCGYYDIISHENTFLTTCQKGKTEAFEPDGDSYELKYTTDSFYLCGTPKFKKFVKDNPKFLKGIKLKESKTRLGVEYPLNDCLIGVDAHLVESDDIDEPILVFLAQDIMKVVHWDKQKKKWKHVESLGDKTLFLGNYNQPLCCSAIEFPELRKNSIYFSHKEEGICCLSDNEIESETSDDESSDDESDPIWITPKLE